MTGDQVSGANAGVDAAAEERGSRGGWPVAKGMRAGACYAFFMGVAIGLPYSLGLVSSRDSMVVIPVGLTLNYIGFGVLSVRFAKGSTVPVSIASTVVLFVAMQAASSGQIDPALRGQVRNLAELITLMVMMLVLALVCSAGNMAAAGVARWVVKKPE